MGAPEGTQDRTSRDSVVVAYDGSPSAQRALLHATDLVGRGHALRVINVIPAQGISARLETVSDAQRGRQQTLLREAQTLAAARQVEAETIQAVGDPFTEIIAAADAAGARMIVVGRGPSRAKHLVRGSLSAKLVRAAKCDVLVVH